MFLWLCGINYSFAIPSVSHLLLRTLQVAAALCVVHVMIKLKSGDSGSLSVSLIERIAMLAQKVLYPMFLLSHLMSVARSIEFCFFIHLLPV